jgi:hypothetical protein
MNSYTEFHGNQAHKSIPNLCTMPVLKPTTALMNAINRIDLSMVKRKLVDRQYGKGWTAERAEQIATRYRRFLFLTVTRSESIVPTRDIDEMWHAHILDTRAYAVDCQYTFGFFLHHFPYFGTRDWQDAIALKEAFQNTAQLYETLFDGTYELDPHGGAGCSSCRGCSSCKDYEF